MQESYKTHKYILQENAKLPAMNDKARGTQLPL
jgi:hypothetical protein